MICKATLIWLRFGRTVLVTTDCREHWWVTHPKPSQYLTYREYSKMLVGDPLLLGNFFHPVALKTLSWSPAHWIWGREMDRALIKTAGWLELLLKSKQCTSTQLRATDKIKRCLLLGRKVMTNLDSILKSRDILLPTKIHLVKAMVFPVVMYGCESWTVKKAEHRIDAFELWCWRRLLRVPWTARRSNQSILKESVLNIHWKDWC